MLSAAAHGLVRRPMIPGRGGHQLVVDQEKIDLLLIELIQNTGPQNAHALGLILELRTLILGNHDRIGR